MRAAVYYTNHDVRVEDRPVPAIGAGELLMRIERSGICGSDVMEWYRRHRAPLVLGHEVAGTVAAVGTGVRGYRAGDRVTAAHHVPCNACRSCRRGRHTMCHTLHTTNFDPGGFVEYTRLSPIHVDRGVFPLPAAVSFDQAVFVEPLACAVRAQRIAPVRADDTVFVVGSGIIGLLHVKLARAAGARRIVASDLSDHRLAAARRFGADAAFGPAGDLAAQARDANEGRLADLVIVCTGAGTAIAQALRCAEPGGTVMLFAPSGPEFAFPALPFNETFFRTDLTVTTSYGAAPADYAEALDLIARGQVRVDDMITHRLGLSDAAEGFRLVAAADDSIKVILDHSR
ncbi:MAG TPA: alcohol dehydrogenase catalytic domain-containing protein [bacterium]|nr:alcohol dehydrogenase catalytic domain-containing protein [bacterium]